jgi:hypothetical protein
MLRTVLGYIASQRQIYLADKPSHMRSDLDELACPPCTVIQPVAVRRGDRPSYQALTCPITVVGDGAFPGDVKPPSLDIW